MFYENLKNTTVVVTGGIGVELITMLCKAQADLLIRACPETGGREYHSGA